MSKFLWRVAVCLMAASLSVAAEPAAPALGDKTPEERQAERQRLADLRAVHERLYLEATQACYARFAVFDCQREARVARREAIDAIRRQEVRLNDLERQDKAMEVLNRIRDNSSAEQQAEADRRRQEAEQDYQQKQQRAAEDQAQRAQPRPAAEAREAPGAAARSAQDTQREQQRYQEKLQQAQQRKQDKQESLATRKSPPAKPLPLTP